MNVAVGLARLGTETAFVGRLSGDAFGTLLRGHLTDSGVDLTYTVEAAEPTALAVVTLDDDGTADYSFHVEGTADRWFTPAELPEADFACVHAGSLALALEPGASAVADWLAARGTVSLDPNVRPGLLGDREAYRRRFDRWLEFTDILKLSDEDFAWISPGTDPDRAAREWIDKGVRLVVTTRGPRGATLRTSDGALSVEPSPAAVADTIGAGDSFSAALLHHLEQSGDLAGPIDLDRAAEAVRFASRAAALTVSRPGADPPRRGELTP